MLVIREVALKAVCPVTNYWKRGHQFCPSGHGCGRELPAFGCLLCLRQNVLTDTPEGFMCTSGYDEGT